MALWLIRPCIGHSDPSLLPNVGWLGSGPFLVGRIGSGVLIIASLQKRIPAGLCRMWQQKAGHDLGGVLSGGVDPRPPTDDIGHTVPFQYISQSTTCLVVDTSPSASNWVTLIMQK